MFKENCPICLETLLENYPRIPVSLLQCGHVFHRHCIIEVVQRSTKKTHEYCPCCKRTLIDIRNLIDLKLWCLPDASRLKRLQGMVYDDLCDERLEITESMQTLQIEVSKEESKIKENSQLLEKLTNYGNELKQNHSKLLNELRDAENVLRDIASSDDINLEISKQPQIMNLNNRLVEHKQARLSIALIKSLTKTLSQEQEQATKVRSEVAHSKSKLKKLENRPDARMTKTSLTASEKVLPKGAFIPLRSLTQSEKNSQSMQNSRRPVLCRFNSTSSDGKDRIEMFASDLPGMSPRKQDTLAHSGLAKLLREIDKT